MLLKETFTELGKQVINTLLMVLIYLTFDTLRSFFKVCWSDLSTLSWKLCLHLPVHKRGKPRGKPQACLRPPSKLVPKPSVTPNSLVSKALLALIGGSAPFNRKFICTQIQICFIECFCYPWPLFINLCS